MATVVNVRKVKTSQAIQINNADDEALVIGWLSEMGVAAPDLSDLKKLRFWFLRDSGQSIVYVVHPADFVSNYEELSEEDVEPTISESTYENFLNEFKFGENDG